MLDRTNLVALMKQVAKADPSAPVAYSYGDKQLSYAALNETQPYFLYDRRNS